MTEENTESPLLIEQLDGVLTLTLNRPDKKNSLTPGMLNDLGDQLQAAAENESIRVVVLTNSGNTFCAGADLKSLGKGEKSRHSITDVFQLIMDSPKPVIAKIQGHCMGGGVGLAAACDLSIASNEIKMGFTEVRLGVAPAMISVVCLPKMRRGDAMELFLTGEKISAVRAAELGLINRSAPADELDAAVAELIGKLQLGGPNALAASKQLIFDVPGMAREAAFVETAKRSGQLFMSPEAREGMMAFRSKQPAPWVPSESAADND